MINHHLSYDRAGLDLTEASEGLRLSAYQDTGGVWTVGYGHTGPDVYEGLQIVPEMAEDWLVQDIQKAEIAVQTYVKVRLTQDQYDALVDFTFNLGAGALKNSTLLRLLNQGDPASAGREFTKWDHDNGRVVLGLTKRRKAEYDLFIT